MTISQIFLFATLLLMVAALDLPFPSAEYQHEIIYSSGGDELLSETATNPAILQFAAASKYSSQVDYEPAGNLFLPPAAHAVNLFTPNTIQQPAETPGQMENYRKALEEDAREAEREQNDITTAFRGGINGGVHKSYVRVKVGRGGRGYDYGYSV